MTAADRDPRASGEPDEYVPLTDPDKGGQSQMYEPAWYADKVIDYGARCVAAERIVWARRIGAALAEWQQRDDQDPLNRAYKDGRRHAYEHVIDLLGGAGMSGEPDAGDVEVVARVLCDDAADLTPYHYEQAARAVLAALPGLGWVKGGDARQVVVDRELAHYLLDRPDQPVYDDAEAHRLAQQATRLRAALAARPDETRDET